jgi:PPM family protein phosphatase
MTIRWRGVPNPFAAHAQKPNNAPSRLGRVATMQLRWGFRSITGDYRDNNEDRGLADERGRFFIICDGMGGQAAGEKASELTVNLVSDYLDKHLDFERAATDKVRQTVDEAVRNANGEIMALGEVDPNMCKMGTTIVFLLCVGSKIYVGGVGDSPAFRLAGGKIEKLTKDHSLTQALVDAGTITPDEARTHRFKNVLWRYIGTKEGGTGTEPRVFDVTPGDRFLLCSDGAVDGVSLDDLKSILEKPSDPQAAADAVVEAARNAGSQDNITSLVVFVG